MICLLKFREATAYNYYYFKRRLYEYVYNYYIAKVQIKNLNLITIFSLINGKLNIFKLYK